MPALPQYHSLSTSFVRLSESNRGCGNCVIENRRATKNKYLDRDNRNILLENGLRKLYYF